MPERDRYIPGVPCWIDATEPDPDAAVAFYRGLFGWEFEDVMPAGSPARYFIARIRGGDVAGIGSEPEEPSTAAWNTYVWVDDADETAARAVAAGGRQLMEPFDVMDEGRMAVLMDPEGAEFRLWQPRRHRGAKIVNEAGSLNFNGLNTRDPAAAKSFYGSVFGWQTLMVDGAELWTLPGYGDHLERENPGIRERIAAMGATPGFEDVVASILPIPQDQPHTAPHWNVTFAVDDADATAGKATELGGKVVIPPFDAPWVRMTVLADPQGATFIASRFVPENRHLAGPSQTSAGASG